MRKILLLITGLVFLCLKCNAQNASIPLAVDNEQSLIKTKYDPSAIIKIQKIDYFLGIVPGAVQIRKHRWGWASGMLASTACFTTLTISQNSRITKARVNADADPSNANYYEGVIEKARLWRNVGLIGLCVTEAINYISAIRLEDRSDAGLISLYVDPQGSIGLTYAMIF